MTAVEISRPNGDSSEHAADLLNPSEVCDTMSSNLETYNFPHLKLKPALFDSTKTPLVLVACGSFSPPTFLHLRMFEIAADYVRDNTNFEVIGGYMSPVNSNYKKDGLENADARIKMCNLATRGSDWVSVDNWEALAPSYVPTARVLDHFDDEMKRLGGVKIEDGQTKPVRVALLAGADLISTFATPGMWLGYGPLADLALDLIPTSVINFIYENELYNVKYPGHERSPSGSKRPSTQAQPNGKIPG
ncbi:uncharacterized protein KY384_002690 [Bacidia gigantensis]|uniref:uncharacterized protein n=1 Tax=Bacidia gigantensis TaxID=2732470 RepID=UPI001D04A82F|nr:uncharacterized protein KY384_002690 [Bacidia gigantensis]KAG8532812.1 hypothetical protein KY384_002690 [Bacidia gigantensis]